MTRRAFDALLLFVTPLVYLVTVTCGALRFLLPLAPPLRPTRLVVGTLADFKAGLVKPVEFNGYSVYVLMDKAADRPIALNRKCTHLDCNVTWDESERFLCTCHGGAFDRTGSVLRKPPPAPLGRLECVVVGDSVVLLDPEAGAA